MAVGIGSDYAVYFLFRFRRGARHQPDPVPRARRGTMQTSGKAIVYVSSAIAGGYLVLCVSGFVLSHRSSGSWVALDHGRFEPSGESRCCPSVAVVDRARVPVRAGRPPSGRVTAGVRRPERRERERRPPPVARRLQRELDVLQVRDPRRHEQSHGRAPCTAVVKETARRFVSR